MRGFLVFRFACKVAEKFAIMSAYYEYYFITRQFGFKRWGN